MQSVLCKTNAACTMRNSSSSNHGPSRPDQKIKSSKGVPSAYPSSFVLEGAVRGSPSSVVHWAVTAYWREYTDGLKMITSALEECALLEMPCCNELFLNFNDAEQVLSTFSLSMQHRLLHLKTVVSVSSGFTNDEFVLVYFPNETDLAVGGCPRQSLRQIGVPFLAMCSHGGSCINFLHGATEALVSSIASTGKACRGFQGNMVSLTECRARLQETLLCISSSKLLTSMPPAH